MVQEKFGIYLNTKENRVVRINSPYGIPSGEEWVFLTPDVNMTLLSIRELVRQRGLPPNPEGVQWA